MSKKGIIQNAVIIVLAVAIICMSVGYAAVDSDLNINNNSITIQSSKWFVGLENPIMTINSTVMDENIILRPKVNKEANTVNFSLKLKPEDVYEFTVDVRNSGTINATLAGYSLVSKKDGVVFNLDDLGLRYEVVDTLENEALNRGSIVSKTVRIFREAVEHDEDTLDVEAIDFAFSMAYTPMK